MPPDPSLPWWVSPTGSDPDSNPGWSIPQLLVSPLAWSPPQGSQSLLSPLAVLSQGFLRDNSSLGPPAATTNPIALDSAPFSAAPLSTSAWSLNPSNDAPSLPPADPPSSWSWVNSLAAQFPSGALSPTFSPDAVPFAQVPGWPPANGQTPDASNTGLVDSSADPSAATPSAPSGLVSSSPGASGPDLLDRHLANLDQAVRQLNASDLPLSKSGAPYFPPPVYPSGTREQRLDVLRLVAPNIVDYFTDQTPPPLTPNAVGKLPSKDYATGAFVDLFPLLLAALGAVGPAARAAPSTVERLLAHVDAAVARLARQGLTARQNEVLLSHPYLEAAFKGERIDTFAKETMRNDKNLSFLHITSRGEYGPDIQDLVNKLWYDITTRGQWPRHVTKYSEEFGKGTPLYYGDQ